MPTNDYYAMKDIVYPVSQHLLLNDFLEGTDNIAMMVSVKWRRPYKNSDILVRGNSVYANLDPHLKDLVQQLAFNLVCEFKGKRFEIGTGFTDAQRVSMWEHDDVIGLRVKFKFQGLTPDGVPRFPVWLGFRSDADLDPPKQKSI